MAQGAIDRGAADMMPGGPKTVGQGLGLEEPCPLQDGFENERSLGGELQLGSVEIAAENGTERFVWGEVLRFGW
jgi:hypothetical protein